MFSKKIIKKIQVIKKEQKKERVILEKNYVSIEVIKLSNDWLEKLKKKRRS